MLHQYINNKSGKANTKILFGNDTDVTWTTIVRMHKNHYAVMNTWEGFDDPDGTPPKSTTQDWTLEQLKEEFNKQYGSPMQYMSQDDFDWITKEKK